MSTFDVNAILSSTAYGSDGDKIGKVEQVFLDDNSGEPTFLTVNTGLFGAKENFVPVKGARQDGDRGPVKQPVGRTPHLRRRRPRPE